MASVSARYLDLASRSKGELEAVFAAGSPPDVTALTGFEFRGYNQPRAAALLGIRKFVKAFYLDGSGQPFGCNTPVAQNGLAAEWLPRPDDDQPKRYAFFRVEPAKRLPGQNRAWLGRPATRQGVLRRGRDEAGQQLLPDRTLPAAARRGRPRQAVTAVATWPFLPTVLVSFSCRGAWTRDGRYRSCSCPSV